MRRESRSGGYSQCVKCHDDDPSVRYTHWGRGVRFHWEKQGESRDFALSCLRSHLEDQFDDVSLVHGIMETISVRLDQHIFEMGNGIYAEKRREWLEAQKRPSFKKPETVHEPVEDAVYGDVPF